MRHGRGLRALIASAVGLAVLVPCADAAIVFEPGANKVSTPRLALDFGDSGGNVERIDSLRWRDSGGTLGSNLAFNGGADCSDVASAWGFAPSLDPKPKTVGGGSSGSWVVRGRRTIEINSTRPTSCTNDVQTPVRTRYTFFDSNSSTGARIRVERRFGFSSASPGYVNWGLRPFTPSLPAIYDEIFYPNSTGSMVISDGPRNPAAAEQNWNDTWLALHEPTADVGVVLLRDAANSQTPASRVNLALDSDSGNSGAASSSAEINAPTAAPGWNAPVRETEFVCFYDAVTWPDPTAGPNVLPSACSVAQVPINSTTPSISGIPKVANELTANPGAWDYETGAFAYQWLSCTGGSCSPIAGATGQKYTVRDADLGKQLRVDVTATATGGEKDTASSALTNGVAAGPPTNTGPPTISGDPRDDETLTVNTGNWTGSPTSYSIEWLRCRTATGDECTVIAGQTAATYKATRDDVGSTLRARVRATNDIGTSAPVLSPPTAIVQPLVISARMRVSPNPTCTGIETTLNAGESKTPNGPIVRYRWTYKEFPVGSIFVAIFTRDLGAIVEGQPLNTIANATSPVTETTFNWNRVALPVERSSGYVRDPLVLKLEITDRAGDKATTQQLVTFGQYYSAESRASCPRATASLRSRAGAASSVRLTASSIFSRIPCQSRITCSTQVSVVSRFGLGGAAAKRRVLARSKIVSIRGRRAKRVRAKLTRAGRRALRGKRRAKVRVRVKNIDPLGRARTKSYRRTLRRR